MTISTDAVRPTWSFRRVLSISIGLSLLLIPLYSVLPLGGDQALFTLMAAELSDGAVLYRDIWDIKQPGIFLFYQFAQRIPAPTGVAVHILEAVYLVASSTAIAFAIRRSFKRRWLPAFLPLAIMVLLVSVPSINWLTQVEVLAGPLLFGSLWFFRKAVSSQLKQPILAILAGLLGGLVLLLKMIYAPLVLVLWWTAGRGASHSRKRVWVTAMLALGAPLSVALVSFAISGIGGDVLHTWFVYPFHVLQIQTRPVFRLGRSLAGVVVWLLPLVVLSVLPNQDRDGWLERSMLVWIGSGLVLFLAQKWWAYLLMLFLTPLLILGLKGLDALLPMRPRSLWLLAVVLAALPLVLGVSRAVTWGTNSFAADEPRRIMFQEATSSDFSAALSEAEYAMELGARELFVFGDPRIVLYSGGSQLGRFSGWSVGTWDDAIQSEIIESLERASDAAVFVDDTSPVPSKIAEFLETSFHVLHQSANGSWLVPGHG